jgi:hypothetical protein
MAQRRIIISRGEGGIRGEGDKCKLMPLYFGT